MKNLISRNFIWFIITFSTLAFFEPKLFSWAKSLIPLLLGFIMFSIGHTFNAQHLDETLKLKRLALSAVVARYSIMPTVAFIIGKMLNLPLDFLIGFVLVASCPGGTAAGLMSLFAKANVPFTVFLTMLTTLFSPFFMPILIYIFLHKHISIPLADVAKNLSLIVLIPITLSFFIKSRITNSTLLTNILPIISAFSITLVIACVVSLTKDRLFSAQIVVLPVLLLNIIGYYSGITVAKLAKCQTPEQKSLMFEYGMFDTALGVVIATSFFNPFVALPSVFLSIIQNITASCIIRYSHNNEYATS